MKTIKQKFISILGNFILLIVVVFLASWAISYIVKVGTKNNPPIKCIPQFEEPLECNCNDKEIIKQDIKLDSNLCFKDLGLGGIYQKKGIYRISPDSVMKIVDCDE